MVYLVKYYHGLGDGGKEVTVHNNGPDFHHVPHWQRYGLSHYPMQALIGLNQGHGQPYNKIARASATSTTCTCTPRRTMSASTLITTTQSKVHYHNMGFYHEEMVNYVVKDD